MSGDLRARASILPDYIDHEGDCASSLCGDCGHCLHSVIESCKCDSCGCSDAEMTGEIRFRLDVLALLDERDALAAKVAELGDQLAAFERRLTACRERRDAAERKVARVEELADELEAEAQAEAHGAREGRIWWPVTIDEYGEAS